MTKEHIGKIYKKYFVPENIIKHMQKVAYVCEKISERFKKVGIKVNKKLITQAALLHDVIRMVDFTDEQFEKFSKNADKRAVSIWQQLRERYQKIGHEKGMAKELIKLKEKKLADIIAKHGFFEVYNLQTWEEKILFYSDKRVDHDKLVSLKKRFSEGKKRNFRATDDLNYVEQTEKKIYQLEREFEKALNTKTLLKSL